jgi:hypothetical protein
MRPKDIDASRHETHTNALRNRIIVIFTFTPLEVATLDRRQPAANRDRGADGCDAGNGVAFARALSALQRRAIAREVVVAVAHRVIVQREPADRRRVLRFYETVAARSSSASVSARPDAAILLLLRRDADVLHRVGTRAIRSSNQLRTTWI